MRLTDYYVYTSLGIHRLLVGRMNDTSGTLPPPSSSRRHPPRPPPRPPTCTINPPARSYIVLTIPPRTESPPPPHLASHGRLTLRPQRSRPRRPPPLPMSRPPLPPSFQVALALPLVAMSIPAPSRIPPYSPPCPGFPLAAPPLLSIMAVSLGRYSRRRSSSAFFLPGNDIGVCPYRAWNAVIASISESTRLLSSWRRCLHCDSCARASETLPRLSKAAAA